MSSDPLISTQAAAALLGVKPTTVYTYVTRGHLESIKKTGSAASWFRQSEIERFAARRRHRGEPTRGTGIAETAITEIDGQSYHYRGRRPDALAREYSFEQVAEFLWSGSVPTHISWRPRQLDVSAAVSKVGLDGDALPLDRLRVAISALAASDHLRFGRQPAALAVTARQLMADLVEALPLKAEAPTGDSIAARLWPRLCPNPASDEQVEALDRALIIIADHGVPPSTLAARIAAGYQADLYGAVQAGLSILAGAWHGGRALSAEDMLEEIEQVGDAELVVGELYRKGAIPCLGQPRYAGEDPRTSLIVDILEATVPGHDVVHAFREIRRIVDERALPAPSVELALAAFAQAFGFTKGGSEAVFAIGRSAGWIAHAIEVYAQPQPPSPEFSYVGVSADAKPDPLETLSRS